jgi:hypothetical protein
MVPVDLTRYFRTPFRFNLILMVRLIVAVATRVPIPAQAWPLAELSRPAPESVSTGAAGMTSTQERADAGTSR